MNTNTKQIMSKNVNKCRTNHILESKHLINKSDLKNVNKSDLKKYTNSKQMR